MDSPGPTRGRSDTEISTLAVEDDEHVTYDDEEDAVRYVAHWMGPADDPANARFVTEPFEQWSRTRCLDAAGGAAAEHVNEVLATSVATGGISTARRSPDGPDAVVSVCAGSVLADGTWTDDVEFDFDDLCDATPRTVRVTYRLGEQVREMTVPVYAEFWYIAE
ncbi:hypothetical protein [Haloarchaeobius sp. DFWS5]|uniref:hypothetical protein n=1 Tax=Haloarchaeobius sp. DFWS5 TaxID=3446114 RepID=UPI003EBCC976